MELQFSIFVAIISLLIGFLIGRALAVSGSDDGGDGDSVPGPKSPSPPADALYIWRDPDNQNFVLQFGERIYHSGDDLKPREKQYFSVLFTHLQEWTGAASQLVQQPVTASQPDDDDNEATITPAKVLASVMPNIPEPPPSSIVAQIDAVLQEKLETSPLEDKGICLTETLKGGMAVMVGLDKYEDIESVPDDEIIALIRSAVSEWEARS
ncbi:MAG: hypothetical protein U9Q82_06500 [Chloroflexota bacterium]|nr:hypothetical protein [Chloroflexota bacterium]